MPTTTPIAPPAAGSSTNVPSATATLQQLETSYGPQAQSAAHAAQAAYFSALLPLEALAVILSAFFVTATVYILLKTGWVRARVSRIQDVILQSDAAKKHYQASWENIERHFFAGSDNDLRIALIDADTLLDEALRSHGVQGTQLGERLKNTRTEILPNLEEVWQAHKLRNRIAHEPNFVLKRDLAERALTVYEKALEHLGALPPEGEESIASTKRAEEPQGPEAGSPERHSPKSH